MVGWWWAGGGLVDDGWRVGVGRAVCWWLAAGGMVVGWCWIGAGLITGGLVIPAFLGNERGMPASRRLASHHLTSAQPVD